MPLDELLRRLIEEHGLLAVVEALGRVSTERVVYERMEAAAEDLRNDE
jgi:hypothetical protein